MICDLIKKLCDTVEVKEPRCPECNVAGYESKLIPGSRTTIGNHSHQMPIDKGVYENTCNKCEHTWYEH